MGAKKKKIIIVYQSTNMEGSTFALSPDSRKSLQAQFGQLVRVARIFIAHDPAESARMHSDLSKPLLALLTGLASDVVAKLPIEFQDPVTERPL